jgi:hypothetical protein
MFEDVACGLRRGNCHIELVDRLSKLVSVDFVDRKAFQFFALHLGTATQRAQLSEELSGIDLLGGAAGTFRVCGKQIRFRNGPPGL